jgi:hypothetical protein
MRIAGKERKVLFVSVFDCTTAGGLNRRDFFRLALMTSAVLAEPGLMAGSEPRREGADRFARLHPLAPGAVRPEGWLRGYLEKQAAQLGSKLPEVSWPFTENYWAGEEKAESWWPWEQKAYWLDGATRLALVLGDEKLMRQVRVSLDYTLTHAGENGYLGPHLFEDPKGGFHRWPQNVFFRGLAALADATAVPGGPETIDIAQALRKHFLNDLADYAVPERNITNIEGMLWAYAHTGDPALLTLAENSWRTFETVANDYSHGDLSEMAVYAATPINSHGVTYAETAKLPAILYLYTGKEEYLRFALAAQRRIFDHHMLIDGIPSTSEFFQTVTSLDSHETCDIADHTWSWGYMLMATGNSIWADRIERACFNAAPGVIKPDWKGVQYLSCPNQFLATHDSDHNTDLDHNPRLHGNQWMAYQPNPGWKTACCGGEVHRIFPNYAIRMWMKTGDGGLAAVLYGPSKVTATVGEAGQQVRIAQTTEYPFRDRIEFTIEAERTVEFPLWLRVPGWCKSPKLELNGQPVRPERNAQGFMVVRRAFKPGDRLTLTLPMQLALSRWPQNGVGIERGPLVYSFPIPTLWTPRQEPDFSTAEFPLWDATPAGEWNYGLDVDPEKLASEIKVSEVPGPIIDPWTHPAVKLTTPARKISGWKLQENPDKPEQKFTPPLPDSSEIKTEAETRQIELIPYGATQLRVTIFPAIR